MVQTTSSLLAYKINYKPFMPPAVQVGGGLGLVSEALAVLNGAHLSGGGGAGSGSRLGNLLRRYHTSLAASRDPHKTSNSRADTLVRYTNTWF